MSTSRPVDDTAEIAPVRRRFFTRQPGIGASAAAKQVVDDARELVRAEIDLAKAELSAAAQAKATGAGLLTVAAVAGWLALQGLLIAIGLALALVLPGWAAALIVTAVLLLVAAVRSARERLDRDLDQLDTEVRAQMSQTAERTAWKVIGTGIAILSGLLARKILVTIWRRATKHEPPTNPAAADTGWGEALAWAVASGTAIGVGRLVATRGATAGWQRVVGAPPPGMSDIGR